MQNRLLQTYMLIILFGSICLPMTQPLSSGPATQKKEEEKNSPEEQTAEIYKWLKTTAEVVSIVEKKSFRNVDFAQFIQEGLKASVGRVDSHSAFIKDFEEITNSTSGKFSGIGVSIISKSVEDDAMVVAEVLDGSPAQESGLQSGDKIVGVNDEKLRGLSSDEVITKMKGKRGTTVKLKIIRSKKPLEFKVKRDTIKNQSSSFYHFKKQNIYLINLKIFSESSARQVKELLGKATKDPDTRGIIMDLRSNPGGVLETAVEMASLFLPTGSDIVSTRNNDNQLVKTYSTRREPFDIGDLPLFILINNFTASASEILAGALRHHSALANDQKKTPKVFLVGTTTFGKGSVQEVIPISNGCALKLTSMLYFLPDDTSIQAEGVKPDILVQPRTVPSREIKWINELYGQEKSMKHHITADEIKEIRAGKTPELTSTIDKREEKKIRELEMKKEKEEEQIKNDPLKDQDDPDGKLSFKEKQERDIGKNYQIQACVNMINMLDLAPKETVNTRSKSLDFLRLNYLADDGADVERLK